MCDQHQLGEVFAAPDRQRDSPVAMAWDAERTVVFCFPETGQFRTSRREPHITPGGWWPVTLTYCSHRADAFLLQVTYNTYRRCSVVASAPLASPSGRGQAPRRRSPA